MKLIRCFLAASLLLPLSASVAPIIAAPTPAPAPKSAVKGKVISKNEVNAILRAGDKAANDKDIDAIVRHMAPDFKAKITVSGHPTMTMNLAQYKAITAQGFEMAEDYQYQRLSTQIIIASNGKSARVLITTREKMTVNGQEWSGTSNATSVLQVRGNRIVFTSMTATTAMSVATEV